jgi:subtilisin family serine protease
VTPTPANPFDELLALVTPGRLLRDPRATGAGVAVAVVDSGIDRAALAARHPDMEPVEGVVFRGTDPAPHPDAGRPNAPHGTTVVDVILTLAPRAKLFSADVFGPRGETEVETVVNAVRHAVDVWKVKVVNLSLGVPEHRLQQLPKRQALYRVVEDAYFRDVLVFAAANNDHPLTKSYPAAYAPPLMSVDKYLFDDPLAFAYRVREKVEFQAHGRAYLGPFAREPATSWAAPHLAGVAAKLLSLKPDLKPFELKTLLYWMFRATNSPSG